MEPTYDVVWPRSTMGVQPRRRAERLPDLTRACVGFLWDDLFRGDELFPILERELRDRYPGIDVVGYDEFGSSHGSDEARFIDGLANGLSSRHIDAVVSGMGC